MDSALPPKSLSQSYWHTTAKSLSQSQSGPPPKSSSQSSRPTAKKSSSQLKSGPPQHASSSQSFGPPQRASSSQSRGPPQQASSSQSFVRPTAKSSSSQSHHASFLEDVPWRTEPIQLASRATTPDETVLYMDVKEEDEDDGIWEDVKVEEDTNEHGVMDAKEEEALDGEEETTNEHGVIDPGIYTAGQQNDMVIGVWLVPQSDTHEDDIKTVDAQIIQDMLIKRVAERGTIMQYFIHNQVMYFRMGTRKQVLRVFERIAGLPTLSKTHEMRCSSYSDAQLKQMGIFNDLVRNKRPRVFRVS